MAYLLSSVGSSPLRSGAAGTPLKSSLGRGSEICQWPISQFGNMVYPVNDMRLDYEMAWMHDPSAPRWNAFDRDGRHYNEQWGVIGERISNLSTSATAGNQNGRPDSTANFTSDDPYGNPPWVLTNSLNTIYPEAPLARWEFEGETFFGQYGSPGSFLRLMRTQMFGIAPRKGRWRIRWTVTLNEAASDLVQFCTPMSILSTTTPGAFRLRMWAEPLTAWYDFGDRPRYPIALPGAEIATDDHGGTAPPGVIDNSGGTVEGELYLGDGCYNQIVVETPMALCNYGGVIFPFDILTDIPVPTAIYQNQPHTEMWLCKMTILADRI